MAIASAKVWFLITGWIAMIALPRIFKWASGSAEAGQAMFGDYKLVFMGVSFLNNAIITGTIQAVSKFTSESDTRAYPVRATALRVQAVVGVGLAAAYAAAAPWIAQWLGSPDLSSLMQISAGVIAAYSFYAVYIGSFNGRRLFSHQAGFDIAYSTLRTTLILTLAAVGLEVLGAVLGFLVAAIIISMAAALASRGLPREGEPLPTRRYLGFAASLFVYTLLLNLVMSLDLFLLKGNASRAALAAGSSASSASEASSAVAGLYGAAQNLAFIPYQAVLAIAFVAFPMISRVTFEKDAEKAKGYVRKTMRLTALLSVGLASVFVALPIQSLGLLYPDEYMKAASTLSTLSIGLVAFALMSVANALLNGAGHSGRALAVIGLTLGCVVAGVLGLLSTGHDPNELALRAAMGTASGMILGLVVSGIVVRHRFGALLQPLSAARIVLAGASAVGLGHLLPISGKLHSLAECAAVFAVYVAVLIISREIGRDDLAQLRVIFKRG